MESQFDLQAYLSILRRRYLYLIIPALLIAVASVAFAYVMPPVYKASATILVESQQIPTDLAASTVTAAASERIRVIEQRLMTRDNLLQVAQKFRLYQKDGASPSPSAIVGSMRAAASI